MRLIFIKRINAAGLLPDSNQPQKYSNRHASPLRFVLETAL
jgi:hypothetical protein